VLALRPASEADVPYLVSLRLKTMSEHLQRVGVQLVTEEQEARARIYLDSCSIVLLQQQPVGMLKIVREAENWRIVQIQLDPQIQSQGLGTKLLTQVLTEARQAQVPVQLSVLKANQAKNLYERLGFRIVGEDELEYEMQTEV
jgi:ribosomal protein S18 acetylase RimI-like enzyme